MGGIGFSEALLMGWRSRRECSLPALASHGIGHIFGPATARVLDQVEARNERLDVSAHGRRAPQRFTPADFRRGHS